MSKAPNELYERIGNILIDTVGDCDGLEQLTARIYEMVEGQTQALLDITDYAVPPGADPMKAVVEIQKIAMQGLGRDRAGNVIPIYGTRPKTD